MSYIKTNQLNKILTSHKIGFKKIIEKNGENSIIPQIAIGYLKKNKIIKLHKHQTMIEYFFVLKGNGKFKIESKSFDISAGDYIKISQNLNHSILAFSDLEFFYFGLNTTKVG